VTSNATISGTLNTANITTTGNHSVTGNITAQGTLYADRIQSPASNDNLSISAQGTGVVNVQSPLTTVAQTISGNVNVTGTASVTGQFNADNLSIYGNTISSTNTNGNIIITPNGSGQITLSSSRVAAYQLNAVTVAVSNTVDTNTLRSYSSNADITIQPQGTGKTKIINLNYSEAAPYSVAYASTITPDVDNGNIQTVTLTGNVTLSAFTNPIAGQSLTLFVVQDATGSRTLTSTMKFAGGSKTLSTAANSIDIITAYYDGTNYYATLAKAFA
jgi:cytoskeletal protein CcmA (bactofilin family)